MPFDHFKALIGRDDLDIDNEDKIFQLVIDYIKFWENLEG